MSSVNYKGGKCKTKQQVKAYFYHDKRCAKQHSNEHIDKSKSHLNWSTYGLTYQQACEKFDARIAELDATTNKNKRKDRVEMFALTVAAPADLPENQLKAWFSRVTDILVYKYGEQNLIDADFHIDEIHDYVDAETHEKRTSVAHGHYNFVPECDGQLNGKWFSARRHMYELNNAIQAMTQAEFCCDFMTGTKKKSNRTMDELKNASIRAENDDLKAENATLQQEKQQAEQAKQQAEQAKQQAVEQTALYVDATQKHIKPQRKFPFLRKSGKYVMSKDEYDSITAMSADIKCKANNTLTADDERKQAEQERKKAENMRKNQENIILQLTNKRVAEQMRAYREKCDNEMQEYKEKCDKEKQEYEQKCCKEYQAKLTANVADYIAKSKDYERFLRKKQLFDDYLDDAKQYSEKVRQYQRKKQTEQIERRRVDDCNNHFGKGRQFGE